MNCFIVIFQASKLFSRQTGKLFTYCHVMTVRQREAVKIYCLEWNVILFRMTNLFMQTSNVLSSVNEMNGYANEWSQSKGVVHSIVAAWLRVCNAARLSKSFVRIRLWCEQIADQHLSFLHPWPYTCTLNVNGPSLYMHNLLEVCRVSKYSQIGIVGTGVFQQYGQQIG